MNITEMISKVEETDDFEYVNKLLDDNGVILNTYTFRTVKIEYDQPFILESVYYVVGRVDSDRKFTK